MIVELKAMLKRLHNELGIAYCDINVTTIAADIIKQMVKETNIT